VARASGSSTGCWYTGRTVTPSLPQAATARTSAARASRLTASRLARRSWPRWRRRRRPPRSSAAPRSRRPAQRRPRPTPSATGTTAWRARAAAGAKRPATAVAIASAPAARATVRSASTCPVAAKRRTRITSPRRSTARKPAAPLARAVTNRGVVVGRLRSLGSDRDRRGGADQGRPRHPRLGARAFGAQPVRADRDRGGGADRRAVEGDHATVAAGHGQRHRRRRGDRGPGPGVLGEHLRREPAGVEDAARRHHPPRRSTRPRPR
jgi:hypothetical protein